MTNKQIQKFKEGTYLRCLELFAITYEELGEGQKAFNDLIFKFKGNSRLVIKELEHLDSPLNELKHELQDLEK